MQAELHNLLQPAWIALSEPRTLLELALLLGCLGLAYGLRAWLGHRFASAPPDPAAAISRARQFGQDSLQRMLYPLIAAALVLPARALMHRSGPVPLLDLAVPLMTSMALVRLLAYALRRAFVSSVLIARFERIVALVVWGVVALHIVGWLPEVVTALNAVSVSVNTQKLTLWSLLQGAVMIFLALLAALWLARALERRLLQAQDLDDNLRLVLVRLSKAVLLVVSILIVLPMAGIDLTTLSVFGGAIGVGLGFGLQKIAANYVSGFIILMDRSLRIGNLIVVGNERGVVRRITTRYTVIRAANGVESIVPNETLVSSVVQNETFSDADVLLPIDVQVAYESDLERVLPLLEEIGRAHARVLDEPSPKALVMSFADSGINLRLGCWVRNPQEGTGGVRSDLNLAIWKRFREEGVEIPYPQREVRVVCAGDPGDGCKPGLPSGTQLAGDAPGSLA